MKKTRNLVIVLLSMLVSAACSVNTAKQQQAEQTENSDEVVGFYDTETAQKATEKTVKMYEIPAKLNGKPEKILKREGYTVSYNKTTKQPNWVAWHLTKAHTYGKNQRNESMFTPDEDVPAPRAVDNDYYNSRYDRGHMCPAGDNKWSSVAMKQSFLFSNVCPQNHGLNKNEWNDLEIMTREWARAYGAVDVVCGPIFYGKGEQKTIGRNKVWVPDAFFKVILCRQGDQKAIGFIMENNGKKQQLADCIYTVDEVEKVTGMDFFPALDDKVEDKVEAESDYHDWKRVDLNKYRR